VLTFLGERTRRVLATLTAAGLLAGMSLMGILAPASADDSSGALTWGVKESFCSYITSGLAGGSITPSNGAVASGSAYAFSQTSTTYDGATGTTTYAGSLNFNAHAGALDVTLSNLTIVVDSASSATLLADVVGKTYPGGEQYSYAGIPFANLTLAAPSVSGTVATWTGASATLAAEGVPAFAGSYAAGEALDPVTFSIVTEASEPEPSVEPTTEPSVEPTTEPSVEPTTEPSVEPTTEPAEEPTVPVADPQLTVTPSTGIDPAVENTFTVTGTGFVGDGAAWGAYVSIGETSLWTVGDAYPANDWLMTVWVSPAQVTDGSFTTTITIPAGSFDASKTYMVASSAAHGLSATDRTLDVREPITVVSPSTPVANPVLVVTPTTNVDPAVDNTFTITGTGFVGDGAASGAYVALGETGLWSGSGALPSVGWAALTWVSPAQITDGAFTTTLTVPAGTLVKTKSYRVVSSAAHGLSATDRTLDAFAAITLKADDAVVSAGSLIWGVKESFRTYITGPIAGGSIAVSGGATVSGSLFNFYQKSTNFNGSTGTTTYGGSVNFSGHDGILDLTLTNIKIKVTGATTGVVIADVNGKSSGEPFSYSAVNFANLVLGPPTVSGGATTWTNAKATLTAAGAPAFFGYYTADEALDDVTFTVGSNSTPGNTANGIGTGNNTVPAFAAGVYANATASPTTVVQGGEVTVSGSGFGSNTAGIEAAVYSDRVLLASGIAADAAGAAKATVTIPESLPVGDHTLSLEGPNGVKSQVAITVVPATAETSSAATCTARAVSGATLSWGVKSSFRSYITGPIASGEITTSGVSNSDGIFTWGSGTGKYNSDLNMGLVLYGGSVHFSGHGGLLDMTISNVKIKVTSASTASLIADVASNDPAGTTSSQSGIVLASLNLTGTQTTSGNTVSWTNASATLTSTGAAAFSGFYAAGEALDSVSFSFPLGATVSCDASSGANGALAATGADGATTAALMAVAVLVVGAGLVIGSRRRANRLR
jgi:Htaa